MSHFQKPRSLLPAKSEVGVSMRFGQASEYHYISSREVEVIARQQRHETGRRFFVRIGETFMVSPVMPNNHRNRGRICVVRYLKGPRATVEFRDGKGHRYVRVPLCDLTPCVTTLTV